MSFDDSELYTATTISGRQPPKEKKKNRKKNSHYQGIDTSGNRNASRNRINAGDKDASVAADIAMLTFSAIVTASRSTSSFSRATCHSTRAHLATSFEYELTFNDYSRVVRATGDADASNVIGNIILEYEMVAQPDLAQILDKQNKGKVSIFMTRYYVTEKSAQTRERHSCLSTSTCLPEYGGHPETL